MKVGGELLMFEFTGPSGLEENDFNTTENGNVGARIIRMQGNKWMLEVIWMAHIGKVFKRGHIWSWVYFR